MSALAFCFFLAFCLVTQTRQKQVVLFIINTHYGIAHTKIINFISCWVIIELYFSLNIYLFGNPCTHAKTLLLSTVNITLLCFYSIDIHWESHNYFTFFVGVVPSHFAIESRGGYNFTFGNLQTGNLKLYFLKQIGNWPVTFRIILKILRQW